MAITWTKLDGAVRSTQGITTALTESAPSGNTNDGVDLSGVDSIRITVAAPTGNTFSGGGSIPTYRRSQYLGTWDPVDGGTLDMSQANGKTSITFGPFDVKHKSGRLVAVPSGVTVSGGTALTITIEACWGAGGPGQ